MKTLDIISIIVICMLVAAIPMIVAGVVFGLGPIVLLGLASLLLSGPAIIVLSVIYIIRALS